MGVAIIGAGVISKQYLDNLTQFPDLEVRVVADLPHQHHSSRAESRALEYGIPEHGDVDFALTHPEVELIVNLTAPAAHAETTTAGLQAGKHVWSEKPFALERDSGQRLLEEARKAGLRIGCAPDTFLGAGLQTAIRVIKSGDIGTPLSAQSVFQTSGPDKVHPNPAFLYKAGAGPLFDIGPYHLTALVQLLGGAHRVAAIGSRFTETRVIHSGPRAGETFDVEVPTHVSALAEFEGGTSANTIFSFDSSGPRKGSIEIMGTEASLLLPDPVRFDGQLLICRAGANEWHTMPTTGPANGRGMGVLDMVRSIAAEKPHRASGQLAYHIMDTMLSISESIESGTFVDVASSAQPSVQLPPDWAPHELTLHNQP